MIFVIFSGVLFWLRVSDNKKPLTLLLYFWDSIKEFGQPKRIRTDEGKESVLLHFEHVYNGGVSVAGRSVDNQQAEAQNSRLRTTIIEPFYEYLIKILYIYLLFDNKELFLKWNMMVFWILMIQFI